MRYADESKLHDLLSFSDPARVVRACRRHGYDPQRLFISPLSSKKYMYITPENRRIHFGYMGMEDYTRHRDPERRRRFLLRNARWKHAPLYSAAHMSYFLTW